MPASVVKRLEKVQSIFRKEGAWIRMAEALNEEGINVDPTDSDAVKFCLLGAAKHVGDGQKMLVALAQAINPKFSLNAWHADWHDMPLDEFKLRRDCSSFCSFDADQAIEDEITAYNDANKRSLPDIRRVISKAKKLAAS